MKLQAIAAAALLGAVGAASAATVDIGGLTLNQSPTFAVASIYENTVTAVGQTLAGVGEISQINGVDVSTLCGGCELTYQFGGYKVTALSPTNVAFSGGFINFYLGFGAANDFNPFTSTGSAADLAAATNGTLFLTLDGHPVDAAGNTFVGTGMNIGTPAAVGFGAGLADVDSSGSANGNTAGAGAIANAFFDTNSIPTTVGGHADFQLGASFSNLLLPHPGECPGGAECLAGSSDFRGQVSAVPEPETYALLLAGLGAMAFVSRRRRS